MPLSIMVKYRQSYDANYYRSCISCCHLYHSSLSCFITASRFGKKWKEFDCVSDRNITFLDQWVSNTQAGAKLGYVVWQVFGKPACTTWLKIGSQSSIGSCLRIVLKGCSRHITLLRRLFLLFVVKWYSIHFC